MLGRVLRAAALAPPATGRSVLPGRTQAVQKPQSLMGTSKKVPDTMNAVLITRMGMRSLLLDVAEETFSESSQDRIHAISVVLRARG